MADGQNENKLIGLVHVNLSCEFAHLYIQKRSPKLLNACCVHSLFNSHTVTEKVLNEAVDLAALTTRSFCSWLRLI